MVILKREPFQDLALNTLKENNFNVTFCVGTCVFVLETNADNWAARMKQKKKKMDVQPRKPFPGFLTN